MRKLLILSKFEVGISFIPFFIIILFSGYYKLFFTYFLITLIHELGHIIVASIFKVKVNKVALNIFGFNADIEDFNHIKLYKQILIVLAGPLTYFVSSILIKELYLANIISLVMYYKAIATNKYIFLFNLLPIFPLDGGRLFKILSDHTLTYKSSKILTNIVSFIFVILFVIYTMECKQYLMYAFLCINFFMNVISLNKEWKSFLIKRYCFNNIYKEKLHSYNDLYIYKNNYIMKNKTILNEKEAIIEMLKK